MFVSTLQVALQHILHPSVLRKITHLFIRNTVSRKIFCIMFEASLWKTFRLNFLTPFADVPGTKSFTMASQAKNSSKNFTEPRLNEQNTFWGSSEHAKVEILFSGIRKQESSSCFDDQSDNDSFTTAPEDEDPDNLQQRLQGLDLTSRPPLSSPKLNPKLSTTTTTTTLHISAPINPTSQLKTLSKSLSSQEPNTEDSLKTLYCRIHHAAKVLRNASQQTSTSRSLISPTSPLNVVSQLLQNASNQIQNLHETINHDRAIQKRRSDKQYKRIGELKHQLNTPPAPPSHSLQAAAQEALAKFQEQRITELQEKVTSQDETFTETGECTKELVEHNNTLLNHVKHLSTQNHRLIHSQIASNKVLRELNADLRDMYEAVADYDAEVDMGFLDVLRDQILDLLVEWDEGGLGGRGQGQGESALVVGGTSPLRTELLNGAEVKTSSVEGANLHKHGYRFEQQRLLPSRCQGSSIDSSNDSILSEELRSVRRWSRRVRGGNGARRWWMMGVEML